MTPLRQRMLEDMQLHGFAARTQEASVRAVQHLAAHFRRPPDQLGEDELRQDFLYLTNVKHFARASFTIALCGIKFFYERTLSREWKLCELVRPIREKKLPVIPSREEVRRILVCVRLPVYRACLTTIYVCGLRLLEGAHLQVADVDSARGRLHVHGKGRRDRYLPLPAATLALLRAHWPTHRSPQWLFPAPVREGTRCFVPPGAGPISRSSLQSAFVRAVRQSGVHKRAHVHTRRHSYATLLPEAGVNLRLIQVDGRTGLIQRCTLDAVAFLDRFLQHVLPRGFSKVRHYGLFSPSCRALLGRARTQLTATSARPSRPAPAPTDPAPILSPTAPAPPRCPACGVGLLRVIETLLPCGRSP